MLQNLRLAIRRSLARKCLAYAHLACRDLSLARERIAAEESAAWLNQNAPMALSYRNRFELLRRSIEAVQFEGLMCEFGVFRGETINFLAALLPSRTFHGFDSFRGLPENWRAGFEREAFRQERLPAVRPNVCLHKGLFLDSVPSFLDAHEGSVSFLHIDSDLYSSAKVVLDLLGDRIVPGTVIQFDEFLNYPGWQFGERKAFSEFCTPRDLEVEYMGYVVRGEQLALRITAMRKEATGRVSSEVVPDLIAAGNR